MGERVHTQIIEGNDKIRGQEPQSSSESLEKQQEKNSAFYFCIPNSWHNGDIQ